MSNKLKDELIYLFQPFRAIGQFNSVVETLLFFKQFGLDISSVFVEPALFVQKVNAVATAIEEVLALDDIENISSLTNLGHVFTALKEIKELELTEEAKLFYLDMPLTILDKIIIRYLSFRQAKVYRILILLGIINIEVQKNPFYRKETINWRSLTKIFKEPLTLIEHEYGWKQERFYLFKLLTDLKNALHFFDVYSYLSYPSPQFYPEEYQHNGKYRQLVIPIQKFIYDGVSSEWGAILSSINLEQTSFESSLLLSLYATGALNETIETEEGLTLKFEANIDAGSPLGIKVQPDSIELVDPSTGSNPTQLHAILSIYKKPVATDTILLLGEKDKTRLELKGIGLKTGVNFESPERNEFFISVPVDALLFRLEPSGLDGFLSKLLPNDGFELGFDIDLNWSSLDGLTFGGSAGLEIEVPGHFSLGPIKIDGLILSTVISEEGLDFSVLANVNAALGPILVKVNRLGLKSNAQLNTDFTGNLGLFELGLGIAPPSGAALSMGIPILTGGGFIDYNAELYQYSGGLNLNLGTIEITAFAIINTRMPDGSKGFSMLVSISTLFLPPIQLSFGFTLSGVGGLVGINRSLEIEVLKSRIREGAVNAIMFPENPMENAPQIISNLQAVFPPTEGRFVVAPFIRIGYGTPNIVFVDVGVILEFPFNGRIVLIGSVGTQLPTPEEALVKINVDVVGDLNFAEQYIDIRGALRDSAIYHYPLKGDFVFLLAWGARSAFLLSVGGYHPAYTPPSGFPALNRLQVDFSQGPDLKIYGAFYTAITSNSFQLGAEVEVYIKKAPFLVEGNLGFDALLIFRPQFSFNIDIYLVANVKWGKKRLAGAKIDFAFSGPGPFNANGYAKLEFLDGWITKEVDFNYTWGPTRKVNYTPVDLLVELANQVNDNSSWGAVLPDTSDLGVSLYQEDKEPSTERQAILIHPAGALEFRQNILPFNKRIEILGHAPVVAALRFAVSKILLGEEEIDATRLEPVMGEFARSHFENISNEEKLSTPDFEPFESGVQLGTQELRPFGIPEATPVDQYEEIIINSEAIAQSRATSSQPSKGFSKFKKVSERNGALQKPTDRLQALAKTNSPDFSIPKQFALTDKTKAAPLEPKFYSTYSEAKEALIAMDKEEGKTLLITETSQLILA